MSHKFDAEKVAASNPGVDASLLASYKRLSDALPSSTRPPYAVEQAFGDRIPVGIVPRGSNPCRSVPALATEDE